jgi:hypothetical protein
VPVVTFRFNSLSTLVQYQAPVGISTNGPQANGAAEALDTIPSAINNTTIFDTSAMRRFLMCFIFSPLLLWVTENGVL